MTWPVEFIILKVFRVTYRVIQGYIIGLYRDKLGLHRVQELRAWGLGLHSATIGALIIRIGLRVMLNTILTVRNPPK